MCCLLCVLCVVCSLLCLVSNCRCVCGLLLLKCSVFVMILSRCRV